MQTNSRTVRVLIILALVVVAVFEVSLYRSLRAQDVALKEDVQALKMEYSSTTLRLTTEVDILTRALDDVSTQNVTLEEALRTERARVAEITEEFEDVEREFGKVTDSVETLEKLSKTDPELLQKYSKVYFLNEHYTPSDLTVIDSKYDFPNDREVAVHADMWPFLEDLLDDAWDDGEEIYVLSGYRSFDEQNALKGQYTVQYGAGSANSFSADQGYSEHQLGTTVDFTTKEIGPGLTGFDTTSAYQWLRKNAYKYGFIMSYPEGNEHYIFEPWHWRFVGKDLARYLERRDTTFYNLDQRRIDEYLVELFD
jgi:D-alanyl-D-alanine carboxypeptidase